MLLVVHSALGEGRRNGLLCNLVSRASCCPSGLLVKQGFTSGPFTAILPRPQFPLRAFLSPTGLYCQKTWNGGDPERHHFLAV